MRLYKQRQSPHWWVSWYDQNGRRNRRSSGTADKKLAEALAAEWVRQGFLEKHFGKKSDVPFSEALLRYAKTHKRDHPRSFMRSTRYRLKHLQERFGDRRVANITFPAVQEYLDERLETVSLATAQKDLALLKAILNKAFREGLMDTPPRFPRFKSLKARERWLTLDEERRLVAAAPPHLVPLIRFAVDTGGRLSELLRLDWREVDLGNGRVRFVNTKNGEDRTVRLCDRARETLRGLGVKDQGPVFTFRGKAVGSVKTAFDKAKNRAGIANLRFHDLRHTFASRLVQGGVPLYDVMHLTGHKSLEMVQRYAHLAPDYAERAMKALNAVWHDLGIPLESRPA